MPQKIIRNPALILKKAEYIYIKMILTFSRNTVLNKSGCINIVSNYYHFFFVSFPNIL